MTDGIRKMAAESSLEITWEEACYFGFFILLSVTKGLGLYEGQKLFELLVVPAFLFAAAKILITPYTRRQWIMQILLLLLTGIVYYNSRERGVLFLAFTVLGMKNISVKKVFHTGLWVWSACAVFLSIFSYFRLEHTVYRVHAKMGLGHIFRWSLGFSHPNILHITYMALCAFLLYELDDRYKLRHFCILLAGNLLVFLYSVSYTGFGIVSVLLAGGLYVRIRPRFCIVEKLLANLVLPVCLVLSFVLPFFLFENKYAGPVQNLNALLNTRIWLAEQFLRSEYRSLWGADISRVVQSSMTMDNSYVWGYINYGLIFFVLLMAGYFMLLFYDTHRQRTKELMILVCFLGAGWTEPLLFNTSFKNVTLLFLGSLLFGQREGAVEYSLLPWGKGTVRIPFAGLPDRLAADAGRVWKRCRLKLACLVAVGMILGAGACRAFHTVPEGYVVPRFYTDGQEKSSVYLSGPEDQAYAGWKVMNYVDSETPMQLVQGQAVMLETARYYAGSILIGGFCSGAAGLLLFAAEENRKRRTGFGNGQVG
ncbi:MAG: hypothetical protein K2P41_17295 [Lachnospiraceae bacterium]|nr:hypothetical protein [Lachnospiraceae bacterium]